MLMLPLRWTLYTDAWNQKIGGPDTGKVVSGHPMPDSMTLFVKDPTNLKALIQMSYGNCKFYDSDQDSKDHTDWCGPNQNWVPLGAGFKRDFSCHFQGKPGPANC